MIVGKVWGIEPHPNADNLELLDVEVSDTPYVTPHFMRLVTGKHYREGDMGLWIPPGEDIPGWLSYQLWMHGRGRVSKTFEVRDIEIRGVDSPGLWAGEWWRNDKSQPGSLGAEELDHGADFCLDGWLHWGLFRQEWRVGNVVTVEDLERQRSSAAEQPVANRQVAARQSALGASPAAASIIQKGGVGHNEVVRGGIAVQKADGSLEVVHVEN